MYPRDVRPEEQEDEARRDRILDRLLSLKKKDESDAAFARRLGLQPQHLSNYRNGRHFLSLRTAVRVARTVGLSLDWLLLDRGRPFPEPADGDEAEALTQEELETV